MMSNTSSDTLQALPAQPREGLHRGDRDVAGIAIGLRDDDPALELPAKLFEQLPFAVYVCDRDGLVVQNNRRAAELWGRSPKTPRYG